MTLRELIEYVYDNDLDTDLFTSIYNNYYTNKKFTLPDVIQRYSESIREIIELPEFNNMDYHILVESENSDGENWVDVSLIDTATNETLSVDYVDWSELVDLLIEDRVGLCHYDRLAHVMWELTFHGFSREEIKENALDLERLTDESEEIDLDDLI